MRVYWIFKMKCTPFSRQILRDVPEKWIGLWDGSH